MRIQRYHTRKENDVGVGTSDGVITRHVVEDFGDLYPYSAWAFNWYLKDGKIGISSRESAFEMSKSLVYGMMFDDCKLIMLPNKENPKIMRVGNNSRGVLEGLFVDDLIKFIQNNDLTHMYLSSQSPNSIFDDIIIFSSKEPSKKLYEKEKIIPVELKIPTEGLEQIFLPNDSYY